MDTGLEDWNPLIKSQQVILRWKRKGSMLVYRCKWWSEVESELYRSAKPS